MLLVLDVSIVELDQISWWRTAHIVFHWGSIVYLDLLFDQGWFRVHGVH